MLIIDDDIHSIRRYSRIFGSYFHCLSATNGALGLDVFDRESPAVVLCDVKMPGGMSGFEVCRRIKSVAPDVIVVLISVYENMSNRIQGYEYRADDYLNKMMSEKETYLKIVNNYSTKNSIHFTEQSSTHATEVFDDSFEKRVRSIITDFYNASLTNRKTDRISLRYVANLAHMHHRTMQRTFKRELKCNYMDFHTMVRLDLARELLIKNTTRSIGEISQHLCFTSPSNFSRDFKTRYGLTPSKYRSNYLSGAG